MLHPTHYEHRTALDALGVYARRLLALLAIAAVLGALFAAVSPLLPNEWVPWQSSRDAAPAVAPLPPRPATAPARIPTWAWALHSWHSTAPAERGARPVAAPARVPAWYWDWRAWRLAVAR